MRTVYGRHALVSSDVDVSSGWRELVMANLDGILVGFRYSIGCEVVADTA